MKQFVLVLALVIMLIVVPTMADAPPMPELEPYPSTPQLPMSIDGTVTVDGKPAPVGTEIVSHVKGLYVVDSTSSVTLTEEGKWGGNAFAPKLHVQNCYENNPVSFTVNGVTARVKVAGATVWGDSVPYQPGGFLRVYLSVGTLPSTTEATSATNQKLIQKTTAIKPAVATTVPTVVVTTVPTRVIPTSAESYTRPTSVILDRPVPYFPDCPEIPLFTPKGTGAIRVGAWGSGCRFYLDGTLINNGGYAILKGVPPGDYTISYRETGYNPVDLDIHVGVGRYVNVDINPVKNENYVWKFEWMNPYAISIGDCSVRNGCLTLITGGRTYPRNYSCQGTVITAPRCSNPTPCGY